MFFVFSVPKIFPVPKTYKTVSKEVRSAVRRFPWNQLNLSGSRKADTVGCDGTHFIQSSDLIQLLKSSLTSSPAPPLLLPPRTFEHGVPRQARCAVRAFSLPLIPETVRVQWNPKATINITDFFFSNININGLRTDTASIQLLPTTKTK